MKLASIAVACAMLASSRVQDLAHDPRQTASSSAETAPVLRARCEGLAELVAALARIREKPQDRERAASIPTLIARHATAHGWLGSLMAVDLVPPEHAAQCAGELLDQLAQGFGERMDESNLSAALQLSIALERNGRNDAAIDYLMRLVDWGESYDERSRTRRFLAAPEAWRWLAQAHFRAKHWQLAFDVYRGANTSDVWYGNTAEPRWRCRCLLELGSYDAATAVAHEGRGDESEPTADSLEKVGFTDELALAQALSGQRAQAEATLAWAREHSNGRYATDLATLERCWKALHDPAAPADARELAACSIEGSSALATEILIRDPSKIAPLLAVFSQMDDAPATRSLQLVLMDTGDVSVLTAIKQAYDATDDERLRNFLDSSISRWRAASAVRVALQRP